MADESRVPFHNPFSVLKRPGAAANVPNQESEPNRPAEPAPPNEPRPQTPRNPGTPRNQRNPRNPPEPTIARAVIRFERSGRGGKAVTVIEQLNLSPAERETWLKALKTALGTGGTIEGDALVVQGDHRKRLPGILTARGIRKVIVG
jgi:translation initiation factor 1